jgi:hypothetical protein
VTSTSSTGSMGKSKSKRKEGRSADDSTSTGRDKDHHDDNDSTDGEDLPTHEDMKKNAFKTVLQEVVGLSYGAMEDFIHLSGCEMIEHIFDIDPDAIKSIVSESDQLTARHGMALRALYAFVEQGMNAGHP